jgi:hypothetical protein
MKKLSPSIGILKIRIKGANIMNYIMVPTLRIFSWNSSIVSSESKIVRISL